MYQWEQRDNCWQQEVIQISSSPRYLDSSDQNTLLYSVTKKYHIHSASYINQQVTIPFEACSNWRQHGDKNGRINLCFTFSFITNDRTISYSKWTNFANKIVITTTKLHYRFPVGGLQKSIYFNQKTLSPEWSLGLITSIYLATKVTETKRPTLGKKGPPITIKIK